MHLTRLVACIQASAVPFVRKVAVRLVKLGPIVALCLPLQGRICLPMWLRWLCTLPSTRFIKFCARFGYTRPHTLPTNGNAVGDVAPLTRRQPHMSQPPPPHALNNVVMTMRL